MVTKYEQSIMDLGKYFGVTTKDAFLGMLAGMDNVSDVSESVPAPTGAEMDIGKFYMDVTEGGVLTYSSLGRLHEKYKDDQETADRVDEIIAITYEKESLPSGVDDKMIGMNDVAGEEGDDSQGRGGKGGLFSIREVVNDPGGGAGIVNNEPSKPTKQKPSLSAIQIFPSSMSLSNKDTGGIGIFMSALPTLELSRCIPFVDMTVITPTAPVSDDGKIQTMSLGLFLMGGQKLSGYDKIMAEAMNSEVLENLPPPKEAEEGEDPETVLMPSTAGMEMFTSPQTLVPGHESYDSWIAEETAVKDAEGNDLKDADGNNVTVGGSRTAPIIDRFRPLMTLEELNINVTPTTGMMAHKSAEMSIILHDRSRLAEIAEFVKPDLLGKTELLIEYGWAHPDGNRSNITGGSGGSSSQALSYNPFGDFLDNMRCKEKYMVVNSSFNFDDVGQVKIKLKLSMLGATQMATVNIGAGEGVNEVMEQIKEITKAIAALKKKIMGSSGSGDVQPEAFLKSASDTSGAMTIDKKTQRAIQKFIRANKNKEGDMGDLSKNLQDLYGPGGGGKGGVISEAKKTIAGAVAEKVKTLKKTPDPFIRTLKSPKKFVNIDKKKKKHVSFGKMALLFIGKPLASTNRWDEVQLLFYAFNDKASYVKDLNIAQFPINIADFEKKFKEETKTTAQLPLNRMLGFISKNWLAAQSSEAYGMASLFETDDKGNQVIKKKFKEKATDLVNEKMKRLEDAYGDAEEKEFKMPRIKMVMECVQGSPPIADLGETGTDSPQAKGKDLSILRIHFFDKQTSTFSCLGNILNAARNQSLGVLGKASGQARHPGKSKKDKAQHGEHQVEFLKQLNAAIKQGILEVIPTEAGKKIGALDPTEDFSNIKLRVAGGVTAVKEFIKGQMPTIVYGSQNSAVTSADLSSMSNPALTSVNMMRQGQGGGTTAQGARDSGVPLAITPMELQLETFGCPIANFGQQFFCDFGTGTTADNVYAVTGIDHSLAPGKFTTKLKMAQIDAFGKYTSMISNVEKSLAALAEYDEEGKEKPKVMKPSK